MPKKQVPKDKKVYEEALCPYCQCTYIEVVRVTEVGWLSYFVDGKLASESGECGVNRNLYKFDIATCEDCCKSFRLHLRHYDNGR